VAVLRRAGVLASAALVLSAQLIAAASGTALAGETDDGCTAPGRALRYLVIFDRGTSEAEAIGRIGRACGEATVYYPQIGVGVATSAHPEFVERIGLDRVFSAQRERLDDQRDVGAQPPAAGAARTPVPRTRPDAVPTTDRSGEQWDMRAIGADQARRIDPGGSNVLVGVLDSGIDPDHPELRAALAPGQSAGCLTGAPDTARTAWAPTTSPHGTHVAGVIAAADDGKGITGVAPGVRLASVKVIDDRGYVDPEAVVCGLMWAAAHEMRIANSSFVVDPWSLSCAHGSDHRVVHEAIARAVEYSTAAGTLTVAAASNDAVNLTPSPGSGVRASPRADGAGCEALPAGLREVVAVSAVGPDTVKAGYSSYGLGVIDVAAPGGERGDCVLSTVPGGYEPLCGTSMAAPHVTGVAALLASAHPDYPPARLRRALEARAVPIPCPSDYDLTGDGRQDAYCAGYEGYNGFYGHGMVDALAAVAPDPLRRLAPAS
jgi:subtilisin family serine protease